MVTRLACGVCLMTIAMLTCGGLAYDENCADLEFEGLTNGDTVRVEQYSYINVTFHLDTSKCSDSEDSFFTKVSSTEHDHSVSDCIIIINSQACSIPDDFNCECLSDPRGWVRMFRYLNVSGQVPIVWRWNERKSKKRQDNASIVFNVSSYFHTEEKTIVFQGDGAKWRTHTTEYFVGAVKSAPHTQTKLIHCPLNDESFGTVLEFHEFRDGDIVKVQQNSFFEATFYLNTSKCTYSPDWFRIKVLYHQANFSVDVCNVIFEHQNCDISEKSAFCFCKNDSKKSIRVYREFNVPGNVTYTWTLSDSSKDHLQKKAQIIFDVASNSHKEETTAALQKTGSSYKEETTTVIQATDCFENRTRGTNVSGFFCYEISMENQAKGDHANKGDNVEWPHTNDEKIELGKRLFAACLVCVCGIQLLVSAT